MILLYFIQNVEETNKIYGPENQWTEILFGSAFFAIQIFKVNGIDFSLDTPILAFARELKRISFKLNRTEEIGEYFDQEGQCPWFLRLLSRDESITVQRVEHGSKDVLYETRVSGIELYEESAKHLDRVVDYCSSFVPEIKTSEEIQRWLNDLS